jgi:hypothetical protein
MRPTTLLLAGPPRSGTTLCCELLNRVPDARALDEPMPIGKAVAEATDADGFSPDRFAALVERFADVQRASLLTDGTALSKHTGGRVLGRKVSDERDERGLRRRLRELGPVAFGVPSSADFTLVLKHPVAFTALLPELAGRFEAAAVVRHPLAILASWESVPMPVRDGRVAMLATLAPEIHARLEAIDDRLDRQVELLAWMFERIATSLPTERVVRYEDLVATGGGALAALVPAARELAEPLVNRNGAVSVPDTHKEALRSRIAGRDEAFRRYYDMDSPFP